MATVWLGNPGAVNPATREPLGEQITVVEIHREWNTLDQIVRTICHDDGHWSQHSTGAPSWVASDDPEIAQRVAAHFGLQPVDPAAAAAAYAAARFPHLAPAAAAADASQGA